ncbi:hypothetical protein QAD02_000529 [Eretmocerus hayati]|uniref:Uncharacterized protein n=1 Tax=Eretmocerus hayati TaxID=131215 RepID=A0ACC2NI92_9HYME|nr:hypothetical protein QAD02_000529 [Eretmocerus hayati]
MMARRKNVVKNAVQPQIVQWAWIKYVVDGVQQKVPVQNIFLSLRGKTCSNPQNTNDFVGDRRYFVQWFTCKDPSDGFMCREPRSHRNKIHPSVLYEATILQLARRLEDFGELPPSRKAPKRRHECDNREEVPEDSLSKVRKEVKQTKSLKEKVTADRASSILSDVMDTDFNKNIYGPFHPSESEDDEPYLAKTKNGE